MALPKLNPGILTEATAQAISQLDAGYTQAQLESEILDILFPNVYSIEIEVRIDRKVGPGKIANWLKANIPVPMEIKSIERLGEDL